MKNKITRTLMAAILIAIYIFLKPYFERKNHIASIQLAMQQNSLLELLKDQECLLYEDADKIPHIKINSAEKSQLTLYACWGYLHGRDRAAQMDYLRRTAYSKKAEVGSYKDIKSDFFMHVIGIAPKAEELFSQLTPEVQKLFLAYSYGVNKALLAKLKDQSTYEFEKLSAFPDPWTPENSLAILLLQSLEQTKDNFLRKLDEENWQNRYGKNAETLFSKDKLPWETYIIKDEDNYLPSQQANPVIQNKKDLQQLNSKQYSINTAPIDELRKDLFPNDNWGSNSWVISPAKSKNQSAWLANDPHLSLKNPPFWYWINVESNDFNTMGANLPGAPVFAAGVNSHVSWGLTNSYLPAGKLYFVPKSELESDPQVNRTIPLIWFKFWRLQIPFYFKSYQRLHGRWPIIPLDLNPELSIIYHWSSLDLEAKDVVAFFDLPKAKSAKDINSVLEKIKLNSWNFVFADTEGNFGYRATGLIHRLNQKPEFGLKVKSYNEALTLLSAKDYLNTNEIPHLFNPKRGYVATANNRQWKDGNPTFLGSSGNSEFRAHRIEELITKTTSQLDLEKIKEIQCDNQAQDARFFLPLLEAYLKGPQPPLEVNHKHAFEILSHWDLNTSTECRECFLFRRWLSLIYDKQNLNSIGLYKALTEPEVLNKIEFTKVLLSSLNQSYLEFKNLPSNSTWGDHHINSFVHLWDDNFNSKDIISTPGDEETVNPGTADWDGHFFKQRSGASQRMIVEMTKPPKIYSTLAGENQDRESPTLNDPLSVWRKWSNCQLNKKEFPLDWTNLKLQKISF